VLAVELALMTVLRATLLTKNLAPPADTVQSLIHYDSIAFTQISRATHLLDYTGDLMTENLRLHRKRDLLTILVGVLVCMTGKDVRIVAT
jgi:hypothetical protein